ncbi:hypothetical protein HHI36_013001, partial [Cryptolaemus montrouzieri]
MERQKAITKRILETARKESWQIHASTISTQPTEVWKAIERIQGYQATFQISGLKDGDGNLLTSPKDIPNHISETLEKQFSDENSDVEFRKYKNGVERTRLVIDYDNNHPINQLFSFKELIASIHQFRNSAA